jgi:hypothetical protein
MKYFLCLFSLLFLSSLSVFSVNTKLSGVAKDYAGKTISLRIYTDYIIQNERILAETKVDSMGNFAFTADIFYPVQAFIPMEVYNGFIYLEPGKEYEVTLPPYKEKTFQDKLNPFFKPADYLLDITNLNKGDLNYQMMEFEDAFDYFSMKHIVLGTEPDSIQESILQMKNIFPDFTEPFQQRFMDYRFLLLMELSKKTPVDSLITALNDIGAYTENPAFWDAFNKIFTDFIPRSAGNEDYFLFSKVLNDVNAKMLFALLKNRYGITNQRLLELTAIKLLADLIYIEDFDKFKIVEMMQKLGGGISFEENRELLTAVILKATANFIGTPAPDFVGTDINGKEHRLSEYKGKYIYLNFSNTQLKQTRRDLNVLLRFHETYKKELIILNVFLYDTPEQVIRTVAPFKDNMIFLSVNNPDQLKEIYNIANLPSFFFLDENGNFMMTKGIEPSDELRVILQRIISEKK